jgi:hypothetical protein
VNSNGKKPWGHAHAQGLVEEATASANEGSPSSELTELRTAAII